MKIIFMGTPNFAVPILRSIYDSGHKILEVYTQPATKSGRGQKINHSDIFKCAEQLNLKVRSPDTLETVQEINHIKKLKPDLVVVVAYGKILPTKLLNIDKLTFINAHASLLPKWRGAAPIQRAIMNMDSETGVSVMKIIPQLDAGPVMLQRRIKIFELLKKKGCKFPVIKSKYSYVSKDAEIGDGTIIMHKAIVNADVKIGINCIINTKSLIEHDTIIGNHSHISTGVIINGNCKISDRSFIRTGAIVFNNVNLKKKIIIAGKIIKK